MSVVRNLLIAEDVSTNLQMEGVGVYPLLLTVILFGCYVMMFIHPLDRWVKFSPKAGTALIRLVVSTITLM
jgi:hypothetical protein